MSAITETYAQYSDSSNTVTSSPKSTIKPIHTSVARLSQTVFNQQNQGVHKTNAMPHYGGGAEKCARCSKNVYLAEKKVGAGHSYHSSCFSCQTCNRKLDATALSEHKGEIYCKTCYTRQFGVHGLVSGVTMTTEQSVRESRPSRRSSYGSDLDAPVITHHQTRQRAHSNDNVFRNETSTINHDEPSKMFPWRNEVLPEDQLLITKPNTNGIEHLIDKAQQRPTSQIGFEKLLESPYPNTTSAILDMPVISPPKRVDMPIVPTDHQARSRTPSPTKSDVYQRRTSREQPTDISENFARLTLSEINHQLYANENLTTNTNITAKLVSETPIIEKTSPSNVNNNRSPSPTSGYNSSSAHGDGLSRESTASPPSAYVPQHDYLNARPSSPKINHLPSPTIGGKYSTISALIKPHRPLSQLSTPNDDSDN